MQLQRFQRARKQASLDGGPGNAGESASAEIAVSAPLKGAEDDYGTNVAPLEGNRRFGRAVDVDDRAPVSRASTAASTAARIAGSSGRLSSPASTR